MVSSFPNGPPRRRTNDVRRGIQTALFSDFPSIASKDFHDLALVAPDAQGGIGFARGPPQEGKPNEPGSRMSNGTKLTRRRSALKNRIHFVCIQFYPTPHPREKARATPETRLPGHHLLTEEAALGQAHAVPEPALIRCFVWAEIARDAGNPLFDAHDLKVGGRAFAGAVAPQPCDESIGGGGPQQAVNRIGRAARNPENRIPGGLVEPVERLTRRREPTVRRQGKPRHGGDGREGIRPDGDKHAIRQDLDFNVIGDDKRIEARTQDLRRRAMAHKEEILPAPAQDVGIAPHAAAMIEPKGVAAEARLAHDIGGSLPLQETGRIFSRHLQDRGGNGAVKPKIGHA